MTRHMLRRLAGLCLVGVLALAVAAAQEPPTSEPASVPYAGAKVSEWTGNPQVQLPGGLLSAPTRRQTLPPGTLLDSGNGRLLLRLEDESEVLVQPHTRLLLKQPGAGDWNYLQLLWGRIHAHVMKRTGGAPPFQIDTPCAVIAVRGTRFDVEVSPHQTTEVDVFEGLVEVAGIGIHGASVLVRPGYSTRVGPGSAPEPPVPTEEIRPGFEAPEEKMQAEFARERQLDVARAQDNEVGEPPDSEGAELEAETQEGREGPQDPDHDSDHPVSH